MAREDGSTEAPDATGAAAPRAAVRASSPGDAAPDDLSPELAELMRPRRPNDGLPFDELEKRYNFEKTSWAKRDFASLIRHECSRLRRDGTTRIRALDIGCGRGIGQRIDLTEAVRASVDELWGVEPDESVTPKEGVFDTIQHALMEDADLPEGTFDIAYSYMVMEHVVDPAAFLLATARCLRPGGVYLFATPSMGHYFTRVAAILHAVCLDELVLYLVKQGAEDGYHYPVQYRCNSPKRIREFANRTGFADARFVFVEPEGPKGYMKGPLRLVHHAMRAKRRVIRRPTSLLTTIARLQKPA